MATAPTPTAFRRGNRTGEDRSIGQVPRQVLGQQFGRRVTRPGQFFKAFEANRLDVTVDAWIPDSRRGGCFINYLPQHRDRRLACERGSACQRGVQNGAQSVNVRRDRHVFVLACGLFGCHVAWRSHDGTGAGDFGIAFELFGQSKITHVRLLIGTH